jgi:hypothetical protein
MTDLNLAPVCGIYCGSCEYLNTNCSGCGNEGGKPFWTAMLPSKVCPLYDCCRNSKNLEHCGLCEDFPCREFVELRDPNMSDAEFEASLQLRKQALKMRAEIGTAEWLGQQSAR